MRIELKFQDNAAIVSLKGRFLGGGDGPFLRQKVKDLIEAGTQSLIIDLAGVPYIDSTGLGFLAGVHTTAQHAGVAMMLASPNSHVRKVLDEVRLSEVLTIVQDVAAALEKMHADVGEGPQQSKPQATKTSRGKKNSPDSNA